MLSTFGASSPRVEMFVNYSGTLSIIGLTNLLLERPDFSSSIKKFFVHIFF